MDSQDRHYQEFWANYAASCPEAEPSPNFMPNLWEQIDRRRTLRWRWRVFTQGIVTAAACLCLLLASLSANTSALNTSYLDMLAAYHAGDNPLVMDDGDTH